MDFMRLVTKIRDDLAPVIWKPIPNRGHPARFVN